jgi:hypothetical protein
MPLATARVSRRRVGVTSILLATFLLLASSALASGPMMGEEPSSTSSEPTSTSGGTGTTGTGKAGQPGGAAGSGTPGGTSTQGSGSGAPATSSAPRVSASPQSATTHKAASTAKTTTRKATTPRAAEPAAPIETIVQLPQPTAQLEAGPAPTGLSSGEPSVAFIETASTEQPRTFPFGQVALALALVAFAVALTPSLRGRKLIPARIAGATDSV